MMRNKLSRALLGLAVAFDVLAACAFSVSEGEVKVGEWNGNFTRCRQYADAHHVPLVLGWSYDSECPHCLTFDEQERTDKDFAAWRRSSGFVFCYIAVTPKNHLMPPLTDDQRAAYDFARFLDDAKTDYGNEFSALPMMAIYWRKPNGLIVKRCFPARRGQMPCGTSSRSLMMQLADSAQTVLADFYKPFYGGGLLMSGASPSNRLETFGGAGAWVELPLRRENGFDGWYTNVVKIVDAAGHERSSLPVAWQPGETNRFVRYEVPADGKTGDCWSVRVMAADGRQMSEGALAWVDPRSDVLAQTSPRNPKWIGEPFAFGEWTMDLAAATNFVASTPEAQFALVALGGPLWCPGCQALDSSILNQPDFRAWSVSNRLTLVSIDEPRAGTESGTLLSHEQDVAAASGSPYLSRKMVSVELARPVLRRNLWLTREGWNPSESDRLPNPTLILLRKDGSVVGRLPTRGLRSRQQLPLVCRRLAEMMRTADDPNYRDEDNFWRTTRRELTVGEPQRARVIFGDAVDVYRLKDVSDAVTVKVRGAAPANVSLRLFQIDAKGHEIHDSSVRQRGSLHEGVAARRTFEKSRGPVFAEVMIQGLAKDVEDSSLDYEIEFCKEKVGTVAAGLVRDFHDIPVTRPDTWGDTNALGRLVGLLSVSLPKNGLARARLRMPSGDISYVVPLDQRQPLPTVPFSVTLQPLPGTDDDMMSEFYGSVRVSVDKTGALTAHFGLASVLVRAQPSEWSASNPATSWVGQYNVALPQRLVEEGKPKFSGVGYVGLKMTKAMARQGRMAYSVCFPNGRVINGSAIATRSGGDILVPILASVHEDSGDDVISGILRVSPPDGAYKSRDLLQCVWVDRKGYPFWLHQTEESTIVSLDAVGGPYVPSDLSAFCEEVYETNKLEFVCGNEKICLVSIEQNKITSDLEAHSAEQDFTFDAENGVFFGKIQRSDLHIIYYRGMVFPGWANSCAACGGPQPKRPSLPFGLGSSWLQGDQKYGRGESVRIGHVIEE